MCAVFDELFAQQTVLNLEILVATTVLIAEDTTIIHYDQGRYEQLTRIDQKLLSLNSALRTTNMAHRKYRSVRPRNLAK